MQQHSKRGSENISNLRAQNVCLSERKKKKGVELWGSVSIYRDQRTLKIRHRRLGCVPYHHPKAIGPKSKTWKFNLFRVPFGTPKVPNWPLDTKHSFVFRCCLDSSSRGFLLFLVPRCVFILRLWFFISFLDNSGYLRIIIL